MTRDIDLSLYQPRPALHPEVSHQSDKWVCHAIFLVPRLFTHEHDGDFRIPLRTLSLGRGLRFTRVRLLSQALDPL